MKVDSYDGKEFLHSKHISYICKYKDAHHPDKNECFCVAVYGQSLDNAIIVTQHVSEQDADKKIGSIKTQAEFIRSHDGNAYLAVRTITRVETYEDVHHYCTIRCFSVAVHCEPLNLGFHVKQHVSEQDANKVKAEIDSLIDQANI